MRSNLVFKKVAKDQKYKENYKIYSNLYEDLIKRTDKNDIENNYIYLQGFIDGILLRENLSE